MGYLEDMILSTAAKNAFEQNQANLELDRSVSTLELQLRHNSGYTP